MQGKPSPPGVSPLSIIRRDTMNDYLTVQCNGFVTYCDALIARYTDETAQSFFFSLVGSPSHVQAASAHFFSGGLCRVSNAQDAVFELGRGSGTAVAARGEKAGRDHNLDNVT